MQKQKYKTQCKIKQKMAKDSREKKKFINPKQRKNKIMKKSKRALINRAICFKKR